MKNRLPVSSFGLRVLQKLNNPKGGILMKDGRARVKTLVVPASVIRDFLRKDLIVIRKPNRVYLNTPGQKLLRRLLHLQKKAKNPTSPFPPSPYQAQHSAYRVEVRGEGKKALKTVRNIGHSPLSWLLKRKDKAGKPLINREHFEAGEKLSRDFEFSGGVPKMTGFYDGVPISGKGRSGWRESCPTERQIAARERVRAALDHVGPGLSDILVRVCCFNEGLEQAEKKLSWPSRSGKLVLKIALDRLAVHYNLKINQNGNFSVDTRALVWYKINTFRNGLEITSNRPNPPSPKNKFYASIRGGPGKKPSFSGDLKKNRGFQLRGAEGRGLGCQGLYRQPQRK